MGRQRAGAVAGMDAGFLDVLHDAGDVHVFAVAERIHIHFDGARQVAVEQHGAVAGDDDGVADVAFKLRMSRTISIARPPST